MWPLISFTAVVALVLGAVAYARLRNPPDGVRRTARTIGIAVHVIGLAAIAAATVDALVATIVSRNPVPLVTVGLSILPIWWITGGIAMRFGLRRDELFWWYQQRPQQRP